MSSISVDERPGGEQLTADEMTAAMDQLHAVSMAAWRELLVFVAEDADSDRATVVVHVPVEWFDQTADGTVDDAIAASLESGVPLVYLPGYYVGEQLRVSLPELRDHVRGKGAVGDYLYEMSESSPFLGTERGRTKVVWDLVNVAWVLDPTWLSTGLVPTPRLGRDLRWEDAGPGRHLMREAWGVDRDAVYQDLFRALAERA